MTARYEFKVTAKFEGRVVNVHDAEQLRDFIETIACAQLVAEFDADEVKVEIVGL